MIERDDSTGEGAGRGDSLPVLNEVAEIRPIEDQAASGAAASAAGSDATVSIEGLHAQMSGLLGELVALRAAMERIGARLGSLESRGRETGELPVLVAAVWTLVRLDVPETRSFVLRPRTRIGRAADCEIALDVPSVSRHHALVHLDAWGAVIEDLNSMNGVYVNGRKLVRARLRDGDAVSIGEAKFRVAGPEGAGAPPDG